MHDWQTGFSNCAHESVGCLRMGCASFFMGGPGGVSRGRTRRYGAVGAKATQMSATFGQHYYGCLARMAQLQQIAC